MIRLEFGTGVEEFTRAIEGGPPYLVRYHWAGGSDARAREIVTQAVAACFSAKTLEAEQRVEGHDGDFGPLADRIRYTFWLLRIFDLSLGFTYGPGSAAGTSPPGAPAPGDVRRISMRVDRSRYREEYDEY